MIDWLANNWQSVYAGGAVLAWLIFALMCFFGIWWFAAEKYQFPGLAFGWLPGGIAALTAGVVAAALWPILVLGALLWFLYIRAS